jgi:hypothetical protein
MNQSDHFEPFSSSDYAEASLRNRAVSQFSVDILDWRPDFVKAYYLDQLGHPEDRDLGTSFDLAAGYSPAALGASRSDAFLAATSMVGGRFDDEGYLWFGSQLSGRQGSGKFREVIGGLEMLAYQRIRKGRDQTLVADARIDWSAALSRDRELLAGGGDGGLRGYPINYFTGTRRAIFHFEDRTPIVDDLFHMLSVGAVGFVDAGQVWGRGRNFGLGNFAASVGVGLRLAITRSARQIPLRIDFAIPLTNGGRPFDISSGSGQAFDPFASPFAPANNATHADF